MLYTGICYHYSSLKADKKKQKLDNKNQAPIGAKL